MTTSPHPLVRFARAARVAVMHASFLLFHVGAVVGLILFPTAEAFACCAVLYLVRMFGIAAGYHRYFSHRTFRTSRAFQAVLAFLAESSFQRGVLWWAATHRHHHRHSDQPADLHSPRQHGLWHAHVGWLFDADEAPGRVRDFERFPELRWLDRYDLLPPFLVAGGAWALLGLPGLLTGFCLSTVLAWHAIFAVNSFGHRFGRRDFPTRDDSRNNTLLALLTLGEGWHNNHHFFPASSRVGFRLREVDPTWWVLRALAAVGVVWELAGPPAQVLSHRLAPEAEVGVR